MPPKSKLSRVEWTQCDICKWKFSSKDLTIHQDACPKGFDGECLTLPIDNFKHGFVIGKTLVTETIISTDLPSHLSNAQCRRLVFMNPTTMRMCSLHLGKPVLLCNREVFLAWPNRSIPLTTIAVIDTVLTHAVSLSTHQQTTVCELSQSIPLAMEMVYELNPKETFAETLEFSHYLCSRAGEYPIAPGNEISFTFYGRPCLVLIHKLVHSSGSTSMTNQCNMCGKHWGRNATHESEEHVEDKLHRLCISDSLSPCSDSVSTSSCVCNMVLQSTDPRLSEFCKVDIKTKVTMINNAIDRPNHLQQQQQQPVTLSDVGGLEEQVKLIREMMDLHLCKSHLMKKHGVSTPRGLLLYGPSGTGKSLLAKALAHSASVHVVEIQGPDIWSKFYGESEAKLASLFHEATNKAPSVLILDELDTLCPKRDNSRNETEKRLVTSLLTLLDTSLEQKGAPVFVLAATNKRDDLDPALRRPGRLDREIEIGVPSASNREKILSKLLNGIPHSMTNTDIRELAEQAHSYVGADLAALCKEANMRSLRRSEEQGVDSLMTVDDMRYALTCVQPSAMREVAIEVPKVSWSDIGGQSELKFKLKQAIEWPLKHPEAFQRLGIRPPRGLLMYGPPGCSKTMIAKALARESGINFISIKGPELFSKWVGESEKAVREVFRKARSAAPAIIFFDEIDALAVERGSGGGGGGDVADRVLAQLLTEIDGVEALQDVTIVAATNRPDRIDKALMRPGRLDRIVYVPLPDAPTRAEIFQIHFRKTPVGDDVDVDELVKLTKDYSGAEVSAVCQEAALGALQEDIGTTAVQQRHFMKALEAVNPRITTEMMAFYNRYATTSGLHSI